MTSARNSRPRMVAGTPLAASRMAASDVHHAPFTA